MTKWESMDTFPRGYDKSVLLLTSTGFMYCGRKRYGNWDEPQPSELAWRCDSSGKFTTPVAWTLLPEIKSLPIEGKRK